MNAYALLQALFAGPHEGSPTDWLEKEIRIDNGEGSGNYPVVAAVDEKGSCILLRTVPARTRVEEKA